MVRRTAPQSPTSLAPAAPISSCTEVATVGEQNLALARDLAASRAEVLTSAMATSRAITYMRLLGLQKAAERGKVRESDYVPGQGGRQRLLKPLLAALIEAKRAIADKDFQRGARALMELRPNSMHNLLRGVKGTSEPLTKYEAQRHELVLRCQPLIVRIANEYANRGTPFADLVQEGNIGLLRGLDLFEPQRGYRLSTFVTYWIRAFMRDVVVIQSRAIRLPEKLLAALRRVQRAESAFYAAERRRPSLDELHAATGLPIVTLRRIESLDVRPPRSLDEPNRDELPLKDRMTDSSSADPGTLLDTLREEQEVRAALAVLDDRERHIVEEYYGFGEAADKSLKEIGEGINLSRERVRQLNVRALGKLRRELG